MLLDSLKSKFSGGRNAGRVALAVGAVVLLSRRTAFATDWQGGIGDWFNPANWTTIVPNAFEYVHIENGGDAQVSSGSAQAGSLFVGDSNPGGRGEFDLFGGSMAVNSIQVGGSQNVLPANFTQTGGTLSFGNFTEAGGTVSLLPLTLGTGGNGTKFTQTGGSLVVPSITVGPTGVYSQSNGLTCQAINQNGGTVNWSAVNLYGTDAALYTGTGVQNYNYSSGIFIVQTEYVGNNGTASYAQTTGTNTSGTLTLGYQSGDSGTYSLSSGTLQAVTEYVGFQGSGSLNQTGGAHGSNVIYIGYNSGAAGNYNLSAGTLGSVVSPIGFEYIGYSGTGSFTQSGGANTCSFIELAQQPGSVGSYVQAGGATTAHVLFLGYNNSQPSGTASYTLQGGSLTVGTLFFGNSATFSATGGTLSLSTLNVYGGTVTAGGTNTMFPGPITVGTGGNVSSLQLISGAVTSAAINLNSGGLFAQYGGSVAVTSFNQTDGTASFNNLSIGSAGSPANYTLSGGSLTCSTININSGTFTIAGGVLDCTQITLYGGGTLSVPGFILDPFPPLLVNTPPGVSSPAFSFGGISSQGAIAAVNVYLGYKQSTPSYDLNYALAATNLYLGYNAGSNVNFNLDQQGTLTASTENIGYRGAAFFSQQYGNNTAGTLNLGGTSGAQGTYFLEGGTASFGQINLNSQGTFDLISGLLAFTNVNQTGGSFVATTGLVVANTGTYSLSGTGTLTVASTALKPRSEQIGGTGNGSFVQSGGSNVISGAAGNLIIGQSSGPGTYSLGAGTLSVAGSEYLGYNTTASSNAPAVGNFNQSGGANSAAALYLGYVSGTGAPYSVGTYNLSGGTLSVGASGSEYLGYNGGTATFVQTGGRNSLYSLNIDRSATPFSTGSLYNLQGGMLSAEFLNLTAGNFIQSGGLNTLASLSIGTSGLSSNDLSAYTISGGTLSVGYNLSVTSGSGAATLEIQKVAVTAGSGYNSGLISLAAGMGTNMVGDLDVGSYGQAASGELDIQLAGMTAGSQYGVLSVTGSAALGGTLSISLADGFVPAPGDVFDIIDAGSVNGTFSTVQLPGGSGAFAVQYTPTGVVITAIPEPASAAILGAATAVLLIHRRRRLPAPAVWLAAW